MHLRTLSRSVLSLLLVAALPRGASSFDEDGEKTLKKGDVLPLLEDGTLKADLTAHGANRLTVKLTNQTSRRVSVEFPPGMVGDTYARFGNLSDPPGGGFGGGGGGGGGQTMGLLGSTSSTVPPNGVATVQIATACLNYGVPEPTPRSVVFLKRVEDFTSNTPFQSLLKQLVENKVPVEIAQAALWHLSDGLDWNHLNGLGPGNGHLFSSDDLQQAQQWVSTARRQAVQSAAASTAERKASRARTIGPMTVLVHPDPRGGKESVSMVIETARRLRTQFPDFDVAHRNELGVPSEPGRPALAWFVFVRYAKSGSKQQVTLTVQRNVWAPATKSWRRDTLANLPLQGKAPAAASGEWLAGQIIRDVTSRGVRIDWTMQSKQSQRMTVYNDLPFELTGLEVRDGRDSKVSLSLKGLAVAPGGSSELKLDEDQTAMLSKGKKLLPIAFTTRSAAAVTRSVN